MYLILKETYEAISANTISADLANKDFSAEASSSSSNDGKTVIIGVKGVLTNTPSFMAAFFGGGNTTYSSLSKAILKADSNPSVNKIVLDIDSPGGTVAGLFSALDVIKGVETPIESFVSGTAASAAYAIASSTDKIVAESVGDRFGSVGIVIDGRKDPNSFSITSSGAKNKRPDPETAEGLAEIQSNLDEAEGIFSRYIAEGRGVEASEVMDKFGNGGVFFSEKALEIGLIDEIKSKSEDIFTETQTEANIGVENMDAKQLEKEHPEVFAQVKQLGADEATDKINAHIHMGKETGALDVAFEAISNGEGMTETAKAKYLTASLNKGVADDLASDGVETQTAAIESAQPSEDEESANMDKVAQEVFNNLTGAVQ